MNENVLNVGFSKISKKFKPTISDKPIDIGKGDFFKVESCFTNIMNNLIRVKYNPINTLIQFRQGQNDIIILSDNFTTCIGRHGMN